ncbi:hypothetical protein SAMN04515668_4784 [Hymenobacter arizonensis]|uniref:Uncharacterized protein n=2 Tax=Hymenobacter arizonensis TaxID=1227077 RepID=A0A1I6BN05_HYMAR|nr:hypothetical protein SAMN04515668_4784 [Hymenobacter arizonensis]
MAKSLVIGLLTHGVALLMWLPYTPKDDPNYTRESFTQATLRVCVWLLVCLVLSYTLHTRPLIRTAHSGRKAYELMWLLHLSTLAMLLFLYGSVPSGEVDTEPFWG